MLHKSLRICLFYVSWRYILVLINYLWLFILPHDEVVITLYKYIFHRLLKIVVRFKCAPMDSSIIYPIWLLHEYICIYNRWVSFILALISQLHPFLRIYTPDGRRHTVGYYAVRTPHAARTIIYIILYPVLHK